MENHMKADDQEIQNFEIHIIITWAFDKPDILT